MCEVNFGTMNIGAFISWVSVKRRMFVLAHMCCIEVCMCVCKYKSSCECICKCSVCVRVYVFAGFQTVNFLCILCDYCHRNQEYCLYVILSHVTKLPEMLHVEGEQVQFHKTLMQMCKK